MTFLSRRSGFMLVAGLLLATLAAYAAYARPANARPTRPLAAAAVATGGQPNTLAATLDALQQPAAAHDALAAIADAVMPQRVAADGDAVQLSVRSDRSAVLRGGDGEVHVELTLEADEHAEATTERQPSDVLVVLDVSGSMEGEKLDHAKQALHQLVRRLDAHDRFGLVAYASDAELLLPLSPATRALRAQADAIVADLGTLGGTNISAGLDLALSQLQRQREHGRSARVLLLSDGQANEGDSSPSGLQQRARNVVRAEHVLSTLGIGEDFNEDLMASLADVGTGNFYYLSRMEVLGDFLDGELRANQQTVAHALELRFNPGPGVKVLDASGYPLEQDGEQVKVRPGNLIAGQKRTLWFTLQAPTDHTGPLPVGSISLAYKHGDVARQLDADALPMLAVVDDAEQFERAIDTTVWQRYVLGEQRHLVEQQIGAAVGNGTAKDIDDAAQRYASNRELAAKLNAPAVSKSIDDLLDGALSGKKEQAAPAAERNYNAKQRKARALYDRRADAYLANPYSGL